MPTPRSRFSFSRWRRAFAVLVVGLFGGFACFWWGEFGETSPDRNLVTHEQAPRGECGGIPDPAQRCRNPADLMTGLQAEVAPGLPGQVPDVMATLADEEEDGAWSDPRAMSTSALPVGPWAPALMDTLNAMVIGSEMFARGFLSGDSVPEGGGLEALLRAVPGILPGKGYVSSGFGWRKSPFTRRRAFHKGVDFAVPWGSPVLVTADGVVRKVGRHRALGKFVIVDHGFGIQTRYGHNSAFKVQAGDQVRRGDTIALAGSTGRSTGSHIHYELWLNGRPVDPSSLMFDLRRSEHLARGGNPMALASAGDGQAPASEADGVPLPVGGDDSYPDSSSTRPAQAGTAQDAGTAFAFNMSFFIAFLSICGAVVASLAPHGGHWRRRRR